MTAGIVGGIDANNKRQADFLYYNSLMILNLLDAVKSSNTKIKILYTGSTCIYPRENPQPINESRFMAGPLEETNKGYAVAKGMGVVAAEMFRRQYDINTICAMPTNLFGPNDNYDPDESHFLAAVIKKLYDAKYKNIIPVFWGSGNPRREALYSDDCADTCIHLMKNYNETGIVNIGTGFDYSIKEFIEIGKKVIGYNGEIKWDTSKPDGTYEKRTDISFLKSLMPEFNPRPFEDGLKEVLKIDFNVE
jgi:GDP-L-fucose synthase